MTLFASKDRNEFAGVITDPAAHRPGVISLPAGKAGAELDRKRRPRTTSRSIACFAVATAVLAVSSCGQTNSKTYDISPIFPLTANKCAKYGGKTEGTGFNAHCWVTKAECQQAAQDWMQAMQQGGVTNAIEFKC
jgi:hypothetical protein